LAEEIIMKANQVLLEMVPDIQHSDNLEIQYAQIIPDFIENLGNSKVRCSPFLNGSFKIKSK
jgi:hypothetical protein